MQKIVAERVGVGLVKAAQFAQALLGGVIAANLYPCLAQRSIELVVAFRWQAVGRVCDWRGGQHLRQIDHGMACHGEGELRLPCLMALYTGNQQG